MEGQTVQTIIRQSPVLAIVGLGKNVGKTTFLNYLLRRIDRGEGKVMVCTIGRDGEDRDVLECIDKPAIHVFPDDRVLTSSIVSLPYGAFEIEEVFDTHQSRGGLILGKALIETSVELVGPSDFQSLGRVIDFVRSRGIAQYVWIDGALNRLTHGHSGIADGLALVVGAMGFDSVHDLIQKVKVVIKRFGYPVLERSIRDRLMKERSAEIRSIVMSKDIDDVVRSRRSWLDGESIDDLHTIPAPILFSEGVLTDQMADRLWQNGLPLTVAVCDGSRILLSARSMSRLERVGIKIGLLHQVPIVGIAMNAFGTNRHLDPQELEIALKEAFPRVWIVDVFRSSDEAQIS